VAVAVSLCPSPSGEIDVEALEEFVRDRDINVAFDAVVEGINILQRFAVANEGRFDVAALSRRC
jgi:hypothetical protein